MTTTNDSTTATASPAATPADERVPAWNRLMVARKTHKGYSFPENATVKQAGKVAGLWGWEVQTAPLHVTMPDGLTEEFTPSVCTIRKTEAGGWAQIAPVGTGYTPVQNEEAFQFAEALLEVYGEASVTAAGLLDPRGGRCFMSLRIPEHVKVGGKDAVDTYLTVITGHNGQQSLATVTHHNRLACTNQIGGILRGKNAGVYRVRHTANAMGRVQEAREALSLTFAETEEWTAAMEGLLQKEMTVKQFDGFVARVLIKDPTEDASDRTKARIARQQGELRDLFAKADTQDFGRGTRYAAYNAVAEWTEWVNPRQSSDTASSTLFGKAAQVRQRAYNVLAAAR